MVLRSLMRIQVLLFLLTAGLLVVLWTSEARALGTGADGGSRVDIVVKLKANPKAIGWFVGQVIKASGGKANPQTVNELLKAKLGL